MRGFFVSYHAFLASGRGGGVQICTREYIDAIEAAGVRLTPMAFDIDRRWSTRALRRLTSSAYFRPAELPLLRKLETIPTGEEPDFVFLNQVAIASLAPIIKARCPAAKIVLLSHGLESTDLLHLVRLRSGLPLSGRVRPTAALALGDALLNESRGRSDIDLVCTLSPFDADLESWIGARRAIVLPRIIEPAPLEWRPTGERAGYLGTLDHAPNLEGLVEILGALRRICPDRPRIRVVGGPERIGRWLAARFPQVDYLGALSDEKTREEAATWNAFLHPIFCQARGCSTKLATAIGWQIPIVTTTQGHRGYTWTKGSLLLGDNPTQFAETIVGLLDREAAEAARFDIIRVAETSPTRAEVAAVLGAELRTAASTGGVRVGRGLFVAPEAPCVGS